MCVLKYIKYCIVSDFKSFLIENETYFELSFLLLHRKDMSLFKKHNVYLYELA